MLDSTFDKIDYTENPLPKGEYESCSFLNCDLLNATFDRTNLEKADFRTSFNYSISPETNRIKKARFSLSGIAGLLDKYDIEIE